MCHISHAQAFKMRSGHEKFAIWTKYLPKNNNKATIIMSSYFDFCWLTRYNSSFRLSFLINSWSKLTCRVLMIDLTALYFFNNLYIVLDITSLSSATCFDVISERNKNQISELNIMGEEVTKRDFVLLILGIKIRTLEIRIVWLLC